MKTTNRILALLLSLALALSLALSAFAQADEAAAAPAIITQETEEEEPAEEEEEPPSDNTSEMSLLGKLIAYTAGILIGPPAMAGYLVMTWTFWVVFVPPLWPLAAVVIPMIYIALHVFTLVYLLYMMFFEWN